MTDIHILIPTTYPDGLPKAADLTGFLRRAEELAFGGLWANDRLFPLFQQTPHLYGLTALTLAAAHTTRVRLGTAVLLMPYRNPALLAREISTLDAISEGRVTLGISLGGGENEHATIHATFRQRTQRLEESIEVLRLLFGGEHVNFTGRFYQLDDATISPRPTQGEGLPIWLGANSEAGLRRVGRLADGWVAGGAGSPEQFATNWQTIRDAAQAMGRSPDALQNGKLVYVWVDDDAAHARAMVTRYVHSYYGPRYDVANTVFGPAEACADRLRAYEQAGCQTLILGPTGLDADQLETITKRLVPLLR